MNDKPNTIKPTEIIAFADIGDSIIVVDDTQTMWEISKNAFKEFIVNTGACGEIKVVVGKSK